MHHASRPGERPRFLADAMLGEIARWLRILGEDCVYAMPSWSDDEVLERAVAEGRVIVTRDAHLVRRARNLRVQAVQVPQTDAEEALFLMYGAMGLLPEEVRLATRCSRCNGALVETDAAGASARAESNGKEPPLPNVRERHERFWSCLACGQAYWRGAHWDTIELLRKRLVARLA